MSTTQHTIAINISTSSHSLTHADASIENENHHPRLTTAPTSGTTWIQVEAEIINSELVNNHIPYFHGGLLNRTIEGNSTIGTTLEAIDSCKKYFT